MSGRPPFAQNLAYTAPSCLTLNSSFREACTLEIDSTALPWEPASPANPARLLHSLAPTNSVGRYEPCRVRDRWFEPENGNVAGNTARNHISTTPRFRSERDAHHLVANPPAGILFDPRQARHRHTVSSLKPPPQPFRRPSVNEAQFSNSRVDYNSAVILARFAVWFWTCLSGCMAPARLWRLDGCPSSEVS